MESGSWTRKAGWKWKGVYMSQQSLGDAESRRAPQCHEKLLCGGESSTAVAILGIPAGMLPKEVREKHRDAPLLPGSLTPVFLVELCHKIQPLGRCQCWCRRGEMLQLSDSEFPAQGETSAALVWIIWLKLWKVWKYQPASIWKKNLSTAGWHNCPGCCPSRYWGAWPAWHPLQRRFK